MYRRRLKIVIVCIAVGMAALIGRAAQLQLFEHGRYVRDAQGKLVRMEVTTAPRGTIFDRAGNVLAEDRPSYDIAIIPLRACARGEEAEAANIDALAKAAGLAPDDIRRLIYGENGVTARLAGNIQRHLKWLEKREMLKLSDADAEAYIETVRACSSLSKARATIRARFGKRCLDTFDREASEPFVIIPNIDVPRRDAVVTATDENSGVKVVCTTTRYYPYGESACHVIGYMGHLSGPAYERKEASGYFAKGLDEIIGRGRYESLERANYFASQAFGVSGVEAAMEEAMRPATGAALKVATRGGDETLAARDSAPGKDITLTLDMRLQQAAEQALGQRKGAIVVMDVNTGEILALASWPRFDLNNVSEAVSADNEDHPLFSRATLGAYTPGSAFKVVEAVAAVHEIPGYETVTYPCHGSIMVGGEEKFCRNHSGSDAIDLHDALKRSCNIFFYHTASRLGGERLAEWTRRFGIGRRTGIEVGDSAGRIDEPTSAGEIWNTAIGQGTLGVTPLQMARVIGAIANGGRLVTPHLVLRPEMPHPAVDMGLRADRLKLVREGLLAVVNEPGGTAYKYTRMKGVQIAGKTGTAETGLPDENNAWFAGWAPYDNPQICVVVVIERTRGHGGEVAGPVAKQIFQAYFGIQESSESENEK